MNEAKAERHINSEISPELFDEEKRREIQSEEVWAIFILAALFAVIKIDGINESAEKEEI